MAIELHSSRSFVPTIVVSGATTIRPGGPSGVGNMSLGVGGYPLIVSPYCNVIPMTTETPRFLTVGSVVGGG